MVNATYLFNLISDLEIAQNSFILHVLSYFVSKSSNLVFTTVCWSDHILSLFSLLYYIQLFLWFLILKKYFCIYLCLLFLIHPLLFPHADLLVAPVLRTVLDTDTGEHVYTIYRAIQSAFARLSAWCVWRCVCVVKGKGIKLVLTLEAL